MSYRLTFLTGFIFAMFSVVASAEVPQDFLSNYAAQAKQENPGFTAFDKSAGEKFFMSKHDNDWSCASCHTENPKQPGKHAETEKEIDPLAPVADASRFTNPLKVEKWFKRSCKDVLGRECTAQEKGEVLTYLMSIS